MIGWQKLGCLDGEVWEQFLRHKLDPTMMPAPSELQIRAFIDQRLEKLQIEDKVMFGIFSLKLFYYFSKVRLVTTFLEAHSP